MGRVRFFNRGIVSLLFIMITFLAVLGCPVPDTSVPWGGMSGLSPENASTTITSTPTLSWDAVDGEGVGYKVQIAGSEAGLEDAVEVQVDDVLVYTPSTALTHAHTHYWRVRAFSENQTGEWSTTHSFTVPWGAMSGLSPEDSGTTTNTTPTLSWDAVDGAVSYEVQIADSEAVVASTTAETVTAPTLEYTTTALTNNHTHYWRVRAMDGDGQAGVWSTTHSFTVSWGSMSGLSPEDGSITVETTRPLSWAEVAGAMEYEVQIADNETGVADVVATKVNGLEHVPTWPTSPSVGDKLYWRVRALDSDGQSGEWSAIISVAFEYAVGDFGPAGGIVFYDKGTDSGGWRYLETTLENQGIFAWGANVGIGGTSTAIGSGAANTKRYLYVFGSEGNYAGSEGNYAAQVCDRLEYGGYNDWFLPSLEELQELYEQLHELTDTEIGYLPIEAPHQYWSSSEFDKTLARNIAYSSTQYKATRFSKKEAVHVRAVRAF